MRSLREIADMRADLDDNIREHGWDASVDAAVRALDWILNPGDLGPELQLRRYVARPDAERRAEWIARGGDPKDWPIEPERPAGSEEKTT